MKRLSMGDAIAQAAVELQTAALGTRYIATVYSVTDRETTGWVVCDVFFRDPASEGRVTVRVNEAVDLAANDLIYIKPDPAGQKNFIFDGFVKGGGTGKNSAGAYIPWVQSPGATSPVGEDYTITAASGQTVFIQGVDFEGLAGAEFVVMSASNDLAFERVLTAGDGLSLTDGGAGNAVTLAVDLVDAWSGLEFVGGEVRIDLDADFTFLGNIGIGGTPNEKLEVASATGARVIFSDGGGANRKVILFVAPNSQAYGRILAYDYGASTGLNLILNDGGGRVSVEALSPAGKFHVDQESSTGAIPVLVLDQADLSEEMIEFVTTIGVGNPVEAIGAKSLTTTHFIKVTLPGALTRYIPVGTIA